MARRTSKPTETAPEVEVEDVEVEETEELDVEEEATEAEADASDDDVDDLEVEDAEEEPEPAPKAKGRAKKAATEKAEKPAKVEIQFGSQWLAEHVSKATGKDLTAFTIRTIIRKMVKEGLLQRNVGEDRSRYNFAGPKDEQVVAVVKYVKSGAAEKAKAEKITEAKTAAAAKKAAAPKAKAAKPAPEPEPEADVEDDDAEDVEDL